MSRDDAPRLQAQLQALFGAELVVERELGRGGMAVVFLAVDAALQRRVAVKMLLPEAIVDVSVVERFLREGRTVASLDHPHVVRVMSVRSHHGTSAIVMQYVDGPSLDVLLQQRGRLSIEEAGRILSQVAAGLQHAHDRGVIHRDVKPANVLIDRDGRAIVTDFGIARRDDGSTPTKTGFVLGTVDYMSPEQRAGERVSPATDQYALGVMAFELLTGRLPFVGDLGATTFGHMTQPPPRLQSIRPELPDDMEALVQRMLAKAPEDRWPSLAEVGVVFGGVHGGIHGGIHSATVARRTPADSATTPPSNTPVVIRAVRETPTASIPQPPIAPTPGELRASRPGVRGIVAGLVAIAVVVVLVVWLR